MASFKRFSQATNGLLMVLGLLLLLMQLHGYLHSSNPDEFPLNKDDHQHTHEDMGVANSPLSGYEKRFDLDAEDSVNGEVETEGRVRLKQRVVSRRSCQTVPLILTPMVTAKPMYINKFDLFL